MYNTIVSEKKNKNKGLRVSFVIHILILLIAFFYYLPQVELLEDEEKPPYAIKVDFKFEESSMSKYAHDDAGAQREKAEAAPQEDATKPEEVTKPEEIEVTKPQEIEIPKPDIKIPTPVMTPIEDPISTTTLEDEAPIKATPTKPKVETPKPVPAPAPTKTTPATPTKPASTSSPTKTTTSGSTSGSSTTKPSTVDGNAGGTGKADAGTGAGKDSGNDGDAGIGNSSDGTGAYDGSGDGVFGRRVVYRDIKAAIGSLKSSGTVSVKICVNRGGIVTFTEVINSESTIKDRTTLKKFLKAAKGYKVQPDLSAPKEQCGKLIFKSDNSANNKLRG